MDCRRQAVCPAPIPAPWPDRGSARRLARPFHGAPENRRIHRPHRSGVQPPRGGIDLGPFTVGLKRLVAPALALARTAEDRPGPALARALRPLRHPVAAAPGKPRHRCDNRRPHGDLLRAGRYASVRELAWGESATAGPLTVRAFQVNHWGARMRSDTYRGYNGYTIEAGRRRVLFGGDRASRGPTRRRGRAFPAPRPDVR